VTTTYTARNDAKAVGKEAVRGSGGGASRNMKERVDEGDRGEVWEIQDDDEEEEDADFTFVDGKRISKYEAERLKRMSANQVGLPKRRRERSERQESLSRRARVRGYCVPEAWCGIAHTQSLTHMHTPKHAQKIMESCGIASLVKDIKKKIPKSKAAVSSDKKENGDDDEW